MRPILVYGYYKSSPNLGDHLFTHALKVLFPQYVFQFTDHITPDMLEGVSTVFFGGGSFLDGAPDIADSALDILKSKNILYTGVGAETDIHPIHQKLIQSAKLVAVRSHLEKVSSLNSRTILIPDLVYALQKQSIINPKVERSLLVVPNINVVPRWDEPYWKHLHFETFKLELAQMLDALITDGYIVDFYAMSHNPDENDTWVSIEIINKMKQRLVRFLPACHDVPSITDLMSQYEVIITQRYHGAILSECSSTPYLSIHHHDKLKNTSFNLGSFVPYFGATKDKLMQEINSLVNKQIHLPIDTNMFGEFVSMVSECVMLE